MRRYIKEIGREPSWESCSLVRRVPWEAALKNEALYLESQKTLQHFCISGWEVGCAIFFYKYGENMMTRIERIQAKKCFSGVDTAEYDSLASAITVLQC